MSSVFQFVKNLFVQPVARSLLLIVVIAVVLCCRTITDAENFAYPAISGITNILLGLYLIERVSHILQVSGESNVPKVQ